MPDQKNQGGRKATKPDGSAEGAAKVEPRTPSEKPMPGGRARGPEGGERDRASDRDRPEGGLGDGMTSNDDPSDEPDEESDRITGRHPSQRDRDLT